MAEVQPLADVPFAILAGPRGGFVAERFAATIASWDRWPNCVWLRASGLPADALFQELADACWHRWSPAAEPPGPGGLRSVRELLRAAPYEATVIVELDARMVRFVRRTLVQLRPALADRRCSVIAVTEASAPARLLCRTGGWTRGHPDSAWEDIGALPVETSTRLGRLARHRPAIAHDLLAAAQVWGPDEVSAALARARTPGILLDEITRALLDRCDAGELAALRACLDTGYWHPQLTEPAAPAPRLRPWVVPLEERWWTLRSVWARALRHHLSSRPGRPDVEGAGPRRTRSAAPGARPGLLQAKLFGDLEVQINGQGIGKWNGQRGSSILRFLLSRPQRVCSRDELLATFWPEVPPEVARNRLQVAVSGLRKAFLVATPIPVIDYADGCYRINPALQVEVDVERFEAALAAARRADRSGDPASALPAYRDILRLYRGDFAQDAPFELWTLLPRETYRLTYVDAVDRMSRILLDRGDLEGCIAAAHRMLDVDPCHEDAHRLLMHCYLQQGRSYQAQRQYEFCRQVLRSTLDVHPAPATTRLYDAIRAGSVPKPALITSRARSR